MNTYCECANRTTIRTLEKNADFFIAVNKAGQIVKMSGKNAFPVYRATYNGEEVTVYASNAVAHEANK